ncbi:hypothetical protein [Salibacterium aidingense]|nr:hypothetical protein [Salibacterium aidingense]
MAEKKMGWKKIFSSSEKDCCGVDIEEVEENAEECCREQETEASSRQQTS